MANPLTQLKSRSEPWLLGCDWPRIIELSEQRLQQLSQFSPEQPPRILLAEAAPEPFLAGFIAACTAQCPVFLGNPAWGDREWQQVLALSQPHLVWGSIPLEFTPAPGNSCTQEQGWILIPTGGSSGEIRFAIHTWKTLSASVQGFCQYFQLEQVNACCVLSLYHVSGLMQFLRCLLSGGQFTIHPFKALEQGQIPAIHPELFFLSLVPTQLQRLLQRPELVDWLRQFQTILLGGAPAWPELLETSRQLGLRLALTYGMTETASQVVTLTPEDFLAGRSQAGQPLPHAIVTVQDEQGHAQPRGSIGRITIQSRSLALGYYPRLWHQSNFQTDDLGCFDQQGYLTVLGRESQKIITGGENVFPAEVEAAIRSTGWVMDVCVIGVPDRQWGEAVTALYVPKPQYTLTELKAALKRQLSSFKCPKHWLAVETLPRNLQGKINRTELLHLAERLINHS